MYEPAILVLGSQPHAAPVLAALERRPVLAWSMEASRARVDPAVFAWADALVVIDTTDSVDAARDARIRAFPGPTLLAAASPLAPTSVAALMEAGFDVVLTWPSPPAVLAARVASLVRAAPRAAAPAMPSRRVA